MSENNEGFARQRIQDYAAVLREAAKGASVDDVARQLGMGADIVDAAKRLGAKG